MAYIAVHRLEVYQLAEDLSDLILHQYDTWAFKAKNTIGLQVIRSSYSISANIAEGYGRFSAPDRKRFYTYCKRIAGGNKMLAPKSHQKKCDRRRKSQTNRYPDQRIGT